MKFSWDINSTARNEHALPLFAKSNVLPVNFLYVFEVAKLMHAVNSKQALPNI